MPTQARRSRSGAGDGTGKISWTPVTAEELPELSGLLTAIEHYDEPTEQHTLDELHPNFLRLGLHAAPPRRDTHDRRDDPQVAIQALEVFRLRQFDLVLIDLELGSFRALELIRRLRGQSDRVTDDEARTSAPIITIATHEALSDDDRESLTIADTMEAPLGIEEIVQRLHAVFASWRQANPDVPLADVAAVAANRAR